MILTKTQTESVTRGALRVTRDAEGGLHFHRFSEKQEGFLEPIRNFRPKIYCSAGVRFDFYTDSDYIGLSYSALERCTSRDVTLDVYEDGALVFAHDVISKKEGVTTFRAEFEKKGRKRVTVYLPHNFELVLRSLELSDGALAEPYTAYTKKVLMCGDSITQGHHTEFASLSYANRLAAFFDWDMLNQSVAGYWFDGAWVDGNIDFAPELITAAFGTNDWAGECRGEDFEKNVRGFFDSLTSAFPNVPTAVILPVWRVNHDMDSFCAFEELGEKIARVAEEFKDVRVIDAYKFIPHLREFFADDGVHPNSLGHAEYARGVEDAFMGLKNI